LLCKLSGLSDSKHLKTEILWKYTRGFSAFRASLLCKLSGLSDSKHLKTKKKSPQDKPEGISFES
jgi:hypothetical protein